MSNWKGSKGEFIIVVEADSIFKKDSIYNLVDRDRKIFPAENIDNRFDAELFADALNTIQKCDLMPSEILAQRDEIVEFIKSIVKDAKESKREYRTERFKEAQELLTKIKQP